MTEISSAPPRANEASRVEVIDLGPLGDSVQFMFAKLQLEACIQCRDAAQNRMKDIEIIQKDQKASSEMMRRIQDFAKSGKGEPPKDMVEFCKARNIPLPDGKQTHALHASEKLLNILSSILPKELSDKFMKFMTEAEKWAAEATGTNWEERCKGDNLAKAAQFAAGFLFLAGDKAFGLLGFLVAKAAGSDIKWSEAFSVYSGSTHYDSSDWAMSAKQINEFREIEGSKIPTHMVYVQSLIGQYNAFLQGASSAVSQAIQTSTNVARGQ